MPLVTPVERTARLLLLLREPRTLEELRAELRLSVAQLRRDLKDCERAGWPIAKQGKPQSVWLDNGTD